MPPILVDTGPLYATADRDADWHRRVVRFLERSREVLVVPVVVLPEVAYLLAARQIPALEIGDPLGPRAFPQLLGGGLILAAILLFVETLKKSPHAEGAAAAAGLKSLLLPP